MICFAAHPDDETIGVGGQLPFLKNVWIVHATDGAPLDMVDARAHGFTTRQAYANARRQEFLAAASIAGIETDRALTLGLIDQHCSRHLSWLTHEVYDLLRNVRPGFVLAPPYEGGHPDHDSLAFAVHAACGLLKRSRYSVPKLMEYALYHGMHGHIRTGEFLPCPATHPIETQLNRPAALLKRQMLECFLTQRAVLAQFGNSSECFRPAPKYDFTVPPHEGRLFYENFDWGITGAQWREAAKEAARELEIGCR